MILFTKISDQARQRGHTVSTCTILVCVFIKLHIITQSDPVILVVIFYSRCSSEGMCTYEYVYLYICPVTINYYWGGIIDPGECRNCSMCGQIMYVKGDIGISIVYVRMGIRGNISIDYYH